MITTITYRATDQTTGKWYVGSTTKTLSTRRKGHMDPRIRDEFHNTLRKRPDDFVWEVLSETTSEAQDRSHEQEILDCYHGSPYCLNIRQWAVGGDPGTVHLERTEDGKSVHAIDTLGVYYGDPEHQKAAALAAHTEKTQEGKSALAVRMATDTHRRYGKDKWGRSAHPVVSSDQKVLVCENPATGERTEYPSQRVAEQQTGVNRNRIRKSLNTGTPSPEGLVFRYKNEQET